MGYTQLFSACMFLHIDRARCLQTGNAAGVGARRKGVSKEARNPVDKIFRDVNYVKLAKQEPPRKFS